MIRTAWGLVFVLLLGCGEAKTPVVAVPAVKSDEAPAKKDEPKPAKEAKGDFLHQPFQAAIRPTMPTNALPPLMTATGKSVGKIYSEVEKQWDGIRFVDEQGRALCYTARLETELGGIGIELLSDVAPNHVRSFVALARAGYYDGLFFERRMSKADTGAPHRAILGGTPEGDGNDLGSVGYWLLPEILLPDIAAMRGIRHQPGTVGSVHGFQQLDTDGTGFYVCLTEAPLWDNEHTIFGRITEGLDVAERLWSQPVHEPMDELSSFMRLSVIRRVTISVTPLEKGGPASDNTGKDGP